MPMFHMRATELPGLEGCTFLSRFYYLNDEPLYSSGLITPIPSESEHGKAEVPKESRVSIFPYAIAAPTDRDPSTSNWYAALNQFGTLPPNLAFAATSCEFEIFRLSQGKKLPFTHDELFQLSHAAAWSWNIGGKAGPTMQYGPLARWLTPGEMRTPLFFPPATTVDFAVTFHHAVEVPTDCEVIIMPMLRGYWLSCAI